MQTIAAQLHGARRQLATVAGDGAALEARLLAAHAWGITPELLVKHAEEPRDAAPFAALLSRRLQHEPVAQITGFKEFWRDSFIVTRDVLTPRADSETLLETLLRYRPDTTMPLNILDLGTGSGCLLLSALREYPQAQGLGIDRSPAALSIAQRNAEALQLTARSQFRLGDWCQGLTGHYDIILANPPYIPYNAIAKLEADVREFEPHTALEGGPDGLDCYRQILTQVQFFMRPDAMLLFEVGHDQAADVAALGTGHGFECASITPDLAGIARVVAFTLPKTA